jgi:GNAT superfamily N-acetyltransferase
MTAIRALRYEEEAPTPEGYNRLRRDAGWPEMDPTVAATSLAHSCFAVCAYDGPDLVGTGRVVGDLGLCFYIQDVIVVRTHQGKGVGDAIMRRLMKFVSEHAVENTYVGLMSAVGKETFYQRYGFTSRPTEALGAGMTLFWKGKDSGTRS